MVTPNELTKWLNTLNQLRMMGVMKFASGEFSVEFYPPMRTIEMPDAEGDSDDVRSPMERWFSGERIFEEREHLTQEPTDDY